MDSLVLRLFCSRIYGELVSVVNISFNVFLLVDPLLTFDTIRILDHVRVLNFTVFFSMSGKSLIFIDFLTHVTHVQNTAFEHFFQILVLQLIVCIYKF